MAVRLDHTIVPAKDKVEGATFITEILGLPGPVAVGPFMCVKTANGVALDYDDRWGVGCNHYAFEVTDTEFDAILARVRARGLEYWADPGHERPGVVDDRGGGRGFYFEDPSGHNMEVMTSP